jgi:hypothetical protein
VGGNEFGIVMRGRGGFGFFRKVFDLVSGVVEFAGEDVVVIVVIVIIGVVVVVV